MSNDDYPSFKRFRLSETQPRRDFTPAAKAPIQDKDNAQPAPPRPRTVFIPHPRLAPPGTVGVRPAREAAQWKDEKRAERAPDEPRRPFKPFHQRGEKSREWER